MDGTVFCTEIGQICGCGGGRQFWCLSEKTAGLETSIGSPLRHRLLQ